MKREPSTLAQLSCRHSITTQPCCPFEHAEAVQTWFLSRRDCGDNAGVETAAEKQTHRHFAHQRLGHAVFQQIGVTLNVVALWMRSFGRRHKVLVKRPISAFAPALILTNLSECTSGKYVNSTDIAWDP